jgi:hypothetical protein
MLSEKISVWGKTYNFLMESKKSRLQLRFLENIFFKIPWIILPNFLNSTPSIVSRQNQMYCIATLISLLWSIKG